MPQHAATSSQTRETGLRDTTGIFPLPKWGPLEGQERLRTAEGKQGLETCPSRACRCVFYVFLGFFIY
jgi:hypothetical protein